RHDYHSFPTRRSSDLCEACGGLNAAFSQTYVESPRDTTVTGHTWVISNRALNELRVQYPARLWNANGPPGTPVWDRPGEFPPERSEEHTSELQSRSDL